MSDQKLDIKAETHESGLQTEKGSQKNRKIDKHEAAIIKEIDGINKESLCVGLDQTGENEYNFGGKTKQNHQTSMAQQQITDNNTIKQHDLNLQHKTTNTSKEMQNIIDGENSHDSLKYEQLDSKQTIGDSDISALSSNLDGKNLKDTTAEKDNANSNISEADTKDINTVSSEKVVGEPYEKCYLTETQKELAKNMSPEDREKYERTMSIIQKSQDETQKTLDKVDVTIKQLKQTQEGLKETNNKMKKFNDGWENLLKMAISKISNALGPYSGHGNFNPGEDHFSSMPEISDVETVAERILTKSNIIIYTGPGISSASGIPDFKTQQPTWTLRNGQERVQVDELLTKKFFDEKPEEVWRWHHQFRKMVINSAPNDAHYMLADMQNQCKELGINFTLITQNIDSFHVDSYVRSESKSKKNYFEETKCGEMIMDEGSDSYGFCKDVYEIHGNINYMRCAQDCCKKLFPSPLGCPEYFIPKCPQCKQYARPHTKFNGEEYDDYFTRSNEVQDEISFADCLIVIESRLDNSFASTLVSQAMSSGALIVEIGSSPTLEIGNVKQLIGFTEELVPMLCQAIRERLNKFTPPSQSY